MQSFVRESYEARCYRAGIDAALGKTLRLVRWRPWFFSTAMTAGYIGVAAVIARSRFSVVSDSPVSRCLPVFRTISSA